MPRAGGLLKVDWDVDEALLDLVDQPFVERVLRKTLEGRVTDGALQLGLTVTTDESIRELNRRYRDKDSPTDVLSFPLLSFESPEAPVGLFPLPPGEALAVGDIVVSYPRAVEQAERYGHSLEREMAFLLVHGALHLLGYDHEDPADEEQMRGKQEEILTELGLGR